jgi:AcrR family transcriptional regulator
MERAANPAPARKVTGITGRAAAGAGAAPPPPPRGRPRSEQADRAILRAATHVLAQRGLGGMSIEEVASRAGVGKATIYRRWSSRGTLALDAFLAEFQEQQPPPDTGTLRGDLLAALRAWVRSVTQTSAGAMLAGLIAEAQQDPGLAAAWRERVVEPLRAQHAVMLDRAIERGEISAAIDKEVVLDLLFGAAYHRLLHGHQPLNDQFVQRVVDIIVPGAAAVRLS